MFNPEKIEFEKFPDKVWLSTPTMHGEELKYVAEAYETNWMSTVGKNISEAECRMAERVGCKYAVGLSAGTAALHLAIKLAGEKLYGMPEFGKGALKNHKVFCSDLTFKYAVGLSAGTAALHLAIKLAGEKLYGMPEFGKGALKNHKVFCSDLTFCATVNPIVYEGGIPVFIDSERETWNMDPEALEKAFERYPDVRLIVLANLYGVPSQMDEIREIADKYGALIIEDERNCRQIRRINYRRCCGKSGRYI